MERELLKGHLDMLLLAVISRSSGHGYAIAAHLHDQSNGQFDLAEGTLYPALHRLEANGWAISNWQKADGRRRRVYQITGEGQRVLSEQVAIWDSLQTGIRLVLRGSN